MPAKNYASTIYQSLAMGRSATRSELCLTLSDVPWPGRTSKADMWIVSDCSLSRFVWTFWCKNGWYRNTGLSTRRRRTVSDPCSRSHLPCHLRFVHAFSDIFKTESFLSIFLFFFFQKKTNNKKRIKKPSTRNVGYLNRFRRLHKNGKTTEIHCMIAFL